MDRIRIVPGQDYRGEGISQGLARGLLVYHGDCNLTGEGMGIGSVALRRPGCTYFSRSWTDAKEGDRIRRTFTLDTRMSWGIGGRVLGLLTRGMETGISVYMLLPRLQRLLMLPVFPLRNLLGIHPLFETISPLGTVTFTYRVTGNRVEVQVIPDLRLMPQDTLCLLNELSAAWFTAGRDGEEPAPPPPGWEEVRSGQLPVSLVDPAHGIRFSLDSPSTKPPAPFTIWRGREQTGDLCWAGFCIQLRSEDASRELPEVRYSICFTEGSL